MDTALNLCLVGFSHRTAPVAIREQYTVKPEDLDACLKNLCAHSTIEEAYVLSTCNRTEVLVLPESGFDPEPVIKQAVFRNLDEHLYVFRGVHSIIHLFRVASGLDSLVLGESEVLKQVKTAFERAKSAQSAKGLLLSLLRQALEVGKRVRNETDIGQGTLSVAKVGIDIAHHVFGGFERCDALVIGAGETGLLVARHLKGQRIGSLAFANRTFERAEDAAREFGGTAHRLEDLDAALVGKDMIVACVDGSGHTLTSEHFNVRALKSRDRPTLVMDLSVPRAVAQDVADLDNLLLYNLDDLEPVVERNLMSRSEATERTAAILTAEVHKFLALRTYASFSPAIAELRRRFEEVRDEVFDEVAGDRSVGQEVKLAHELSKRLLAVALDQMKEGARRARSEEALDREYQRFLENL